MKRSTDRILTTHVGSLPRPDDVCAMLMAKEKGEKVDAAAFDALVSKAVQAVVRRQVEAGVDIVCDGEMAKPGYATYIKDRLTGFSGDSPRRPPADLALYPAYLKKIHAAGETPSIIRQRCTGPVAVRDRKPLADDLARLDAALKAAKPAAGGFMTAASPGVIANFQPNEFYPSHEKYSRRSPRRCGRNTRRSRAPATCCRWTARIWRWGGTSCSRRSRTRASSSTPRRTSRRSTTRSPTCPPSRCACICAGGTTRARTCAISRCARSSARCSRRSRRGSR